MNQREPTRTRIHGRHVTNATAAKDPGLARIAAFRDIVERQSFAKIDGVMVDYFTSSLVVKIYDLLDDDRKKKYRERSVQEMAALAFKVTK